MSKSNPTDDEQFEYRNALPGEVDDLPDSGMPRQLRTQADGQEPLSPREASVAGVGPSADVVHGEADYDRNREDRADAHRAGKSVTGPGAKGGA